MLSLRHLLWPHFLSSSGFYVLQKKVWFWSQEWMCVDSEDRTLTNFTLSRWFHSQLLWRQQFRHCWPHKREQKGTTEANTSAQKVAYFSSTGRKFILEQLAWEKVVEGQELWHGRAFAEISRARLPTTEESVWRADSQVRCLLSSDQWINPLPVCSWGAPGL